MAHFELGSFSEAMDAANRAVAAAPDFEWGHRLRCAILLHWGDRAAGLEAAREAERLDPQSVEVLYMLARAQRAVGRRDEARGTAERLRDLAPNRVEGHAMLGILDNDRRRWKEAEAHFRAGLASNPESEWLLRALAGVQGEQEDVDSGVQSAHAAVRIDPSSHYARETLGRLANKHLDTQSHALFHLGLWCVFGLGAFALGVRNALQGKWSGAALMGGVGLFCFVIAGLFWLSQPRRLDPTIRRFRRDRWRRTWAGMWAAVRRLFTRKVIDDDERVPKRPPKR
jgi:tetratricopeptide (TPR) repeat protein